MRIYNSLSRKLEKFVPIHPPKVGMYTCGPTVYSYPTIGNWRTYVLSDLLFRSLEYFGYEVDFIMNITDVGHLTGDNLGDADLGEDRIEKAAKKEGKTAWDIAQFYTRDFIESFGKLNLQKPRRFTKATEHIIEQIDLIKRIEARGLSYKTSDGIYFDIKAYENLDKLGKYGKLSTLDKIKEGARVKANPEKKDPRDFALWKFSPKGKRRHMEWDSPWGRGFPGWHIECSAMSIKYLGEQFDIHVGGEDLRSTHHPNEIAQAEAATGRRPFVRYWVHSAFLLVDGGRMGKSLGNAYTLHDVVEHGFSPLDLRYFYLTAHYRKQQNFTWGGLGSAKKAIDRLRREIGNMRKENSITRKHVRPSNKICKKYLMKFKEAISEDLNMPEALAVLWEVVRSGLEDKEKYRLVVSMDKVLGLGLGEIGGIADLPEEIRELVRQRERLRRKKKWKEADKIRKKIEAKGYSIEDTPSGPKVN